MKVFNRILVLISCVAMLCSVFGCGQRKEQKALTEDEIYQLLFDINNKITLSLDMEDKELEKMQADYAHYLSFGSKSPIYRMADLHITIETPDGCAYHYTLEEVGVRMKGNTSRTDFYSPEEGIYNVIHLKLDFQETFDDTQYYGSDAKIWDEAARKERKNRTFATLEKLDPRWNRCDDGTFLKEYFAYETYREYGVLAPRTNLCSFDWAGIHMGVFTINEPVDKIFLEKNLPAVALGGDLYKVGWAGWNNGSFTNTNSIGIEDEDAGEFYAYDLKTNKKTSNHESLIGFIEEMNGGAITKERFAQLVDIDTFLPFAAVSYLLGNPDDMRNNYNNFYIYFRADTGQVMFIPYDYDRCLGVTAHWNPTGDGVTSDNPFATKLAATGENQVNPVLLYSVVAGGYFVREYAHELKNISKGQWFTYENFASLYAIAEENYADLATPGKAFYNTDGLYLSFDLERTSDFSSQGNISFREYLDAKMKTLDAFLENVDYYADQEQVTPTVWYIRADVTEWQNDGDFAMRMENGLVTITITVQERISLKVYNDTTGRWYGSECVTPDCTVDYQTDWHTNIILEAGVYRICMDPDTESITLEKE